MITNTVINTNKSHHLLVVASEQLLVNKQDDKALIQSSDTDLARYIRNADTAVYHSGSVQRYKEKSEFNDPEL